MSSNNHAGSTPEYKDPTAKWIIGVWWALIAIVAIGFYTGFLYVKEEPEPQTSSISTFSEDCVFYRKTMGGDMVISEPSAGTYRYEVYATSDGIEVWKCNNF